MGKHVVSSFSYPIEKDALIEEFDKLAAGEGKNRSQLLVDLMEAWVKKHGKGNPSFKIEQFSSPEFRALPTPWEDPTNQSLDEVSPEDAKFMVGQMAKWYPELQRKAKE